MSVFFTCWAGIFVKQVHGRTYHLAWPALVLGAVLCHPLTASAWMYRSFEHDQSLYPFPPASQYGGAIVVKFRNGSNFTPSQDSRMLFQSAARVVDRDLADLRGALLRANASSPRGLFTRPARDLQEERTLAERYAGEELPDLTQFFTIPVADYDAARRLLDALGTNKLVEVAYAKPLPVPPPTSDFTSYQTYLGPAAVNGYDVRYARTRPGGDGSRARLIDIEYQWELLHEDLQKGLTNILWGTQLTVFGPDHGTAALGISGAISNSYGMEGIVHRAHIDVICATDSSGSWDLANAINQAILFTAPGDVILLEQQGYSSTFGDYCPVEYYADVYSAIANATALGRVIIEPTGNGNLNLDDPAWGGIFQRTTRDSGAIMVGAGTAANRSRCSFSCYGSRVDIQGWGDGSVATLGYGDLYGSSVTNYYTQGFSGTSSASALSAGVASLLESYARAAYGLSLSPATLRSNLVQSGYAQTYGLAGAIGPLPNLSNAVVIVDAVLGADPDGDGIPTWQELLAGTDPTNSASAFRILSIAPEGNDVRVTWRTVGGKTNAVQAASNLAGSYSDVSSNIIITGSSDTTTNYLDIGAVTNSPARFYRVRLVT